MMWRWHDHSWWWFPMSFGMLAFWAFVAWFIITHVRNDRTTTVDPLLETERRSAEPEPPDHP